jgi:hypothetical protein
MTYSRYSNHLHNKRDYLVRKGLASWWYPKLTIEQLAERIKL